MVLHKMKKLSTLKRVLIFILAGVAVFSTFFSLRLWFELNKANSHLKSYNKLMQLGDYIDKTYYQDVNEEDVLNGAMKGYVAGLNDPYSAYMTPNEYGDWQTEESGVSVGIGVTVQLTEENFLKIVEVNSGSPAEIAGLKADDEIIEVDGESIQELEYQEAVSRVRGEADEPVTVKIKRGTQELEKTIVRTEIKDITSYGVMLENNIGYIRISAFKENTAEMFLTALNTLTREGAKGFVFDVRNNGGGLITSLQKIVDPLLPAGEIATATYGTGEVYTILTSDANELNLPMIVLVNGNTASAAELFSASLSDFGKAELVGEQTFGKGIMQNTVQMEDGGAVTLTVATYQTTKGECYHKVGITPDVVMEEDYSEIDFDNPDPSKDAQLRQAISLLSS